MIIRHGCCDTRRGYVFYSVRNGKPLLYTSANEDVSVRALSAPKTHQMRWVGVHTSDAAFAKEVYGTDRKRGLGMVVYASNEEPLSRVMLDASQRDEYFLVLESLEIKNDAVVHIGFLKGATVDIPINDDALDVGHAKLPAGVTAKAVGPAWPAHVFREPAVR